MPRYKWDSAQEWLQDKLASLGEDALLAYAKDIAEMLDTDTIQDKFKDEMHSDYFFKDLDKYNTCKHCEQDITRHGATWTDDDTGGDACPANVEDGDTVTGSKDGPHEPEV